MQKRLNLIESIIFDFLIRNMVAIPRDQILVLRYSKNYTLYRTEWPLGTKHKSLKSETISEWKIISGCICGFGITIHSWSPVYGLARPIADIAAFTSVVTIVAGIYTIEVDLIQDASY